MRVVIVGSGGISYSHAAAGKSMADVELAAVCDNRPDAAAKLAAEHGVPRHYGSVDELLAHESADLAIVAVWGAATPR